MLWLVGCVWRGWEFGRPLLCRCVVADWLLISGEEVAGEKGGITCVVNLQCAANQRDWIL